MSNLPLGFETPQSTGESVAERTGRAERSRVYVLGRAVFHSDCAPDPGAPQCNQFPPRPAPHNSTGGISDTISLAARPRSPSAAPFALTGFSRPPGPRCRSVPVPTARPPRGPSPRHPVARLPRASRPLPPSLFELRRTRRNRAIRTTPTSHAVAQRRRKAHSDCSGRKTPCTDAL